MSFSELTIFHYHLRKGGVTDVVVLSLKALDRFLTGVKKINIILGNDTNLGVVKEKLKDLTHLEINFHIDGDLDYMENITSPPTPEELYKRLSQSFGDSLWWIHNYHLGKNPLFTESLLIAAEQGQKMLLQIHDFPECARYENLQKLQEYIDRDLYPRGENVKYALINQRDVNLLAQAGIPQKELFLLDNPVPLEPIHHVDDRSVKQELQRLWGKDFPSYDPEGALLFYPVRSIRRKNVFEAGFLVKLLPSKANLIITLPGVSKSENQYSDMVDKAFQQGLIPGMSSIGIREENSLVNFKNLWAASDMIISSSIQEGFGYLYVNSLHWQKPLTARYLDIMDGFSHLFDPKDSLFYEEVCVPLTEEQKKNLLSRYEIKLKELDPFMLPGRWKVLLDELVQRADEDRLGFSYLSMELQWEILEQLDRDDKFLKQCRELNEPLVQRMDTLLKRTVKNRDDKIEESFGEKKYAMVLKSILNSFHGGGTMELKDINVQKSLMESFTTLPYIRMLY